MRRNSGNSSPSPRTCYASRALTDASGSGRDALAALSEHGFDLILMDAQTPDMDGYVAKPVQLRDLLDASQQFAPSQQE